MSPIHPGMLPVANRGIDRKRRVTLAQVEKCFDFYRVASGIAMWRCGNVEAKSPWLTAFESLQD